MSRVDAKAWMKTLLGFFAYHFLRKKEIVIIASAMRSGSTLLKALLSEAPEVEHITERPFQIPTNKYEQYFWFWRQGRGRIVIIKKPASYAYFNTYPILPKVNHKTILLVRRPEGVIPSLMEMDRVRNQKTHDFNFLIDYYCTVTENLLRLAQLPNTKIVRYENLVGDPVGITSGLFRFMGSRRTKGTDTYSPPERGAWKWEHDDGGNKIKTLKVSPPTPHQMDDELKAALLGNNRVQCLLKGMPT